MITCDRVTLLTLYISADSCLSVYQVSLNSFLYFQRYAQENLNIANIRMETISIYHDDKVMVLSCIMYVSL